MLRLQTVVVFLEEGDREWVGADQGQLDRHHRLHALILDVIGRKAAVLWRFDLEAGDFPGQVLVARPFLGGDGSR